MATASDVAAPSTSPAGRPKTLGFAALSANLQQRLHWLAFPAKGKSHAPDGAQRFSMGTYA